MKLQTKYQERIYNYSEVCFFRKTKELFGGLSNMASGFSLKINDKVILTSEALYQACRFPHLPEVQEKIIFERSPMTAKMVSKPFRNNSRADWDSVRTDIMYWCLKVKLAQNFISFGQLLESTFDKPIVEESTKDAFWGAIQDKKEPDKLKGVNALGRLLMKLRQEYNSPNRYDLLFVELPNISDFLILNSQIQVIDERQSFIDSLSKHWKLNYSIQKSNNLDKPATPNNDLYQSLDSDTNNPSIVAEPEMKITKPKTKKTTRKPKKGNIDQPELGLT